MRAVLLYRDLGSLYLINSWEKFKLKSYILVSLLLRRNLKTNSHGPKPGMRFSRPVPEGDWLEVEEFSSFHLDNIRINLAIDCAIKEGDVTFTSMTGRQGRAALKTSPFNLPVTLFMLWRNGKSIPNRLESSSITSLLTSPTGFQ